MKTLKTLAIILAIIIVATIIASFTLVYFYGDKIKNLALTEINKNLNSKVDVRSIDVSVIQHFPFASIIMDDVFIASVEGINKLSFKDQDSDTLFYAKEISLNFNLIKVLKNEFVLNRITIAKGKINLLTDKNGADNYHFWKNSSDPKDKLKIDLKNINIRNTEINYSNKNINTETSSFIKTLDLTGRIDSGLIICSSELDIERTSLIIDNQCFLTNMDIISDFNFSFINDQIEIKKGLIKILGENISFSGQYLKNSSTFKDINIKFSDFSLTDLISLIPQSMFDSSQLNIIDGKISIDCYIDGQYSLEIYPAIKINYKIINADFKPENLLSPIENLNANGCYTLENGKILSKSSLTLDSFSLKFNGKRFINGDLKLIDLLKPSISGNITFNIDADDILQFKVVKEYDIKGNISGKVNFSGITSNYKNVNTEKLSWTGNILSSDILIKSGKETIAQIKSGNYDLAENNIQINEALAVFPGINISITGKIFDPVNRQFQSSPLKADLEINSEMLDVNAYLSGDQSDDESSIFTDLLDISGKVNLKKMVYNRFEAEKITFDLSYKNSIITMKDLRFSTCNGKVISENIISEAPLKTINIRGKARLEDIDIHEFFYSFENFGQTFICDKHLTGDLTGDVFYNTGWTFDFDVIDKDITIESSVEVINGELYDFEPMMELSDYLRVPDLKHIEFSNLRNDIVIQDRKVFIPTMSINSTALNLEINGIHDFDQNISYDITLLLSELLSKRFNDKKEEEWIEYDDTSSRAKIFLKAEGNVDNFDIKYDFQRASTERKQKVKEEKKVIKAVLNKEFGLFKKDSAELKSILDKKETKKPKKVQIIWDEGDE